MTQAEQRTGREETLCEHSGSQAEPVRRHRVSTVLRGTNGRHCVSTVLYYCGREREAAVDGKVRHIRLEGIETYPKG